VHGDQLGRWRVEHILSLGLRRHPVALVGMTICLLVGLSGCATSTTTPTFARAIAACTASRAVDQVTVDATDLLHFVPAAVCIKVGGTVTWRNTSSGHDHTSTDEPSEAASAGDASVPPGGHGWNLRLPTGRSAHLTFTKAGVYRYFCIPHETFGMVGVVVVRAA